MQITVTIDSPPSSLLCNLYLLSNSESACTLLSSFTVTLRNPNLSFVSEAVGSATPSPYKQPSPKLHFSRTLCFCFLSVKNWNFRLCEALDVSSIFSFLSETRAISLVWRRSMADHAGRPESLMDKIVEKIHDHRDSSSSSSESESDDKFNPFGSAEAKAKVYRLFGREKPVHKVLGGGKRNLSLSLSLSVWSVCLMRKCRNFTFLFFWLTFFSCVKFSARNRY